MCSPLTFKREVKAKIKFSPVVVFWVLSRMVLEAETLGSSFIPNRTRALPPKLGDCALLNGDLYAKCP